jgi:nitrite reductase/ring-hydroxylating ferredoxin subunit
MNNSSLPGIRHVVCPEAELPPGSRKLIEIDGRSIGVFNLNGLLYALKNVCPHKSAPLCAGPVTGLVSGERPGMLVLKRAGEIVRCPWHGWEFDVRTGCSVFNPHRVRTKAYPIRLEEAKPGPRVVRRKGETMESVETYRTGVEAHHVVIYL